MKALRTAKRSLTTLADFRRRLAGRKHEVKDYCGAPLNNIAFMIDGRVSLCVANSENLLGSYPQQSVKDIMENRGRLDLSSRFYQGEGLRGCADCVEQVKRNNPGAAIFNVYPKSRNTTGFPSRVEFELSNRCNLKCIMCSSNLSTAHGAGGDGLNRDLYDSDFVEQLIPYIPYLRYATFRGGEPFLIPVYYDIWEQMIRIRSRIRISLTTNGTVLNEEVKRVLDSGRFDIGVSIDSLDKELFESIRVNASFETFRRNLDYFLLYSRSNSLSFSSCTCLMTCNFHEIPEIFRFADEEDFPMWINYVHSPHGLSLKSLTGKDLDEVHSYLKRHIPKGRSHGGRNNLAIYQAMLHQIDLWRQEKALQVDTGLKP